ncbi:hypothetical protein [Paenibacillus illinoisensis]|uniref:FtsK gamma domain-containing protein n=1 Tax=Paenibacillus illinoisensis TaxID=59845 RepID=A0A2W0C8A2_9BACL|nr:hypothetical protein [Paenibacillus illinoisensis]PYY28267.1 Uncharacterized protein PIL02S_03413 [Paenibacillus illinoisensis]
MQEVTQELINESIEKAKDLYNEVVKKAKLNRVVYVSWVSRNFPVNWYGANYIISRMEQEGLCVAPGRKKVIER